MRSVFTLGLLLAAVLATEVNGLPNLSSHAMSLQVRGGAKDAAPPTSSTPSIKRRLDFNKCLESTYYSLQNKPGSIKDSEWRGFLNGWLLVTLPLPVPFIALALIANTLVLLLSKWDDQTKNRFLIGLCHGALALVVIVREFEYLQDHPARPRLLGLNLLVQLFLGQAGGYQITKRLMDLAIFGTLFYILLHYFKM
jgi:hypothetical protein